MEKSIKKVFGRIDRERLTSLARELIKIPSENPPGSEKAVGELIYEELTKIGFKTEKIEAVEGRPNVVGILKGTGGSQSLLLCGHSDVVPAGKGWSLDPYGGKIIDGKLYGRGAADMKGSLAAIVEAAKAVQDARVSLKGNLVVAVTVDEEAGGDKGMGYLIKNKLIKADMAVVCEPSDFKLVVAEEGVLWLEFTVVGKTAHTLFWERGVNAIEKMCKLVLKLNELRDRFQTLKHESIGSPIISIGTISGGTKTNMVPDMCNITVDMRLIPTQRIQEVLSEIEKLIDELKNEDPDFKVNVSPLLSIEPFESPKDSEIVRLVRLATNEVMGKEPDFWRKTTTGEDSDMLWLAKYGSIPSVYFGPGKMEQAHAVDEHIEIEDLTNAAKIFAHIILNAVGKS